MFEHEPIFNEDYQEAQLSPDLKKFNGFAERVMQTISKSNDVRAVVHVLALSRSPVYIMAADS